MSLGVQEQSLFSAGGTAEASLAVATYTPLYRKYRPQSFADVVGQTAIIQTLSNAITTSKVAHAYLLCGPRGTGKTSTARIFAKSLNCAGGPSVNPCQTCDSCQGITRGNALDVLEFDAASNTGVDEARELIENVQFAPMAGRYKIYIIDEVHMLSNQAFNALLKTLEEPPPRVIFIFATTEAHKVLPTIISRCQRFDFSRITTQDIAHQLGRIAETEGIRITPEALIAVARHAKGGMRDALGLLDQVGVLSRAQADVTIQPDDVMRFIGALPPQTLFQLTQAIGQQDVSALLEGIQSALNQGAEPVQLVKALAEHFRNLFMVAAIVESGGQPNPDDLGVTAELLPTLQAQAKLFATEEFPQLLEALARIERHMRHTQESGLWMEVGLLELACRKDIRRLADMEKRLAALESQLAGGTAFVAKPPVHSVTPSTLQSTASTPTPKPVVTAGQASTPTQSVLSSPTQTVTPAPLPVASAAQQTGDSLPVGNEDWERIVAGVASPATKALLQHAFLLEVGESALTVGVVSEPILKNLSNPDKTLHLQKAVDRVFGRSMKLSLTLEKDRSRAAVGSTQPGGTQTGKAPSGHSPGHSQALPPSVVPPTGDIAIETRVSPTLQSAAEPSILSNDPSPEASLPAPTETSPVSAEAPQPSAQNPEQPTTTPTSGDMEEAKAYTLDLLQGQLIP